MKKIGIATLCLFACFFSVSISQTFAAETKGAIHLEGWADLEPPQPNQPEGPQGESSLKEQKMELQQSPQVQGQKHKTASSSYPQTNFIRNHWRWAGLFILLILLLIVKKKRGGEENET